MVKDDGSSPDYKEFDPYGARDEKYAPSDRDKFDPFRYRFGLVDRGGTGRFLFGVRWYNPAQGVWVQQDSLDAPFDPVNANRYGYAGGDPVNNWDPSGRWMITAGFEVCVVGCFSGEVGFNLTDAQVEWGAGGGEDVSGSVNFGFSSKDPVTEEQFGTSWRCLGGYYGGLYVGGDPIAAAQGKEAPVTNGGLIAEAGGGCSLSATATFPL